MTVEWEIKRATCHVPPSQRRSLRRFPEQRDLLRVAMDRDRYVYTTRIES